MRLKLKGLRNMEIYDLNGLLRSMQQALMHGDLTKPGGNKTPRVKIALADLKEWISTVDGTIGDLDDINMELADMEETMDSRRLEGIVENIDEIIGSNELEEIAKEYKKEYESREVKPITDEELHQQPPTTEGQMVADGERTAYGLNPAYDGEWDESRRQEFAQAVKEAEEWTFRRFAQIALPKDIRLSFEIKANADRRISITV